MTVYYLDSSAWVKAYRREPGTDRILKLFQSGVHLASAGLGYVEVAAALARQLAPGRISQPELLRLQKQLRIDWANITSLPIDAELIERSVELAEHHKLRGADAVHLAAALRLRDALATGGIETILLSSDKELLQATELSGLAWEDPTFN